MGGTCTVERKMEGKVKKRNERKGGGRRGKRMGEEE